jgi:hypothetical protein
MIVVFAETMRQYFRSDCPFINSTNLVINCIFPMSVETGTLVNKVLVS